MDSNSIATLQDQRVRSDAALKARQAKRADAIEHIYAVELKAAARSYIGFSLFCLFAILFGVILIASGNVVDIGFGAFLVLFYSLFILRAIANCFAIKRELVRHRVAR